MDHQNNKPHNESTDASQVKGHNKQNRNKILNPFKNARFNNLQNGSGFKIDGSNRIYYYDCEGGWTDELGNYFDQNANLVIFKDPIYDEFRAGFDFNWDKRVQSSNTSQKRHNNEKQPNNNNPKNSQTQDQPNVSVQPAAPPKKLIELPNKDLYKFSFKQEKIDSFASFSENLKKSLDIKTQVENYLTFKLVYADNDVDLDKTKIGYIEVKDKQIAEMLANINNPQFEHQE